MAGLTTSQRRGLSKREGFLLCKQAFARYRKARELEPDMPHAGREHLEEIQAVVDIVGAQFVIEIPQPDGVPQLVQFNPKRLRGGIDLSSPGGEQLTVPLTGEPGPKRSMV